MGRRRKPEVQKILDGDPKSRFHPPTVQGHGTIGDPPAWMEHPDAIECWSQIREAAPWLTRCDSIVLEILCDSYADWRDCERFIVQDGMLLARIERRGSMVRGHHDVTTYYKHPLLAHQIALGRFILSVCDKMGLTPASRRAIGIDTPAKQPSALARFLQERDGGSAD